MKILRVRLKRSRFVPGLGSVREDDERLGTGEVVGPWVVIETPGGPVAIWGEDIGPSEIDADSVPGRSSAPVARRTRPAGTEGG